jgi:hypothetical protein
MTAIIFTEDIHLLGRYDPSALPTSPSRLMNPLAFAPGRQGGGGRPRGPHSHLPILAVSTRGLNACIHVPLKVLTIIPRLSRYLGKDTPDDTPIKPEGFATLSAVPDLTCQRIPINSKVGGWVGALGLGTPWIV